MNTCTIVVDKHRLHFVNFLFPEAGSFVLGAIRILVFSAFLYLNWNNRRRVLQQEECNMIHLRGLILPSYSEFFYLLIALNFISGMFDIGTSLAKTETAEGINQWAIPIEMAAFHCLTEGFAVFLLRRGAGVVAFRKALRVGIAWSCFTFVLFFFEIKFLTSGHTKLAFAIFLFYTSLLFLFYASVALIPTSWLDRRPAVMFYARWNALFQLFLIIATALIAAREWWSICSSAVTALLVVSLLQPVVIFKTLQMDSQYWQGVGHKTAASLFGGGMDEIDLTTAASISAGLGDVESCKHHLPILHFGQISLDDRMGYIAGGYSRVYFGKLNKEKVALKMIYSMELSPDEVENFYREANLLNVLRHENIVGGKGICVMPPALTLVLEYCLFGSLFDFLYKYRAAPSAANSPNTHLTMASASSSVTEDSKVLREMAFREFYDYSPSELFRLTEFARSHSHRNLALTAATTTTTTSSSTSFSSNITSRASASGGGGGGSGGIGSLLSGTPADSSTVVVHRDSRMSSPIWTHHLSQLRDPDSHKPDTPLDLSLELGSWKSDPNTPCSPDTVASSSGGHRNNGKLVGSYESTTSGSSGSSSSGGGGGKGGGRKGGGGGGGGDRPSITDSTRESFTRDSFASTTAANTAANAVPLAGSSAGRPSLVDRMRNSIQVMMVNSVPSLLVPGDGDGTGVGGGALSVAPYGVCVPPSVRIRMMRDAVAAVAYVHDMGFMHCDIKSLNFLITENLTVKLADFGETISVNETARRSGPVIQARQWAPPEVLVEDATSDMYTVQSDIYSLSIVLSEILTLNLFSEDCDKMSQANWYHKLVHENFRPVLSEDVAEEVQQSLEKCWSSQPEERLTSEDLLLVVEREARCWR